MFSKRMVFFVVVMAVIAFWLVSRPSRMRLSGQVPTIDEPAVFTSRAPSSQGRDRSEVRTATIVETEKPSILPRPIVFVQPEKPTNMHEAVRELRKRTRGMQMNLRESQYENYRERIDVKASPLRTYSEVNHAPIAKIGGYAIFTTPYTVSRMNDFDGKELPVVVDDRARMGVVNGDIRVIFREYPQDIEAFASRYDLKLIRDLAPLRTAFFAPKTLPAAIVDRVKSILKDSSVRKADLDIIFRTPVSK